MRYRNKFRHQLGVETLESKRLLAGDVTVSVVQGTLVIQGDDASNGVAVRSGDTPDSYFIVGLEAGGEPTSINGVFDRAEVSGVMRGIRMTLGAGDDLANLFQARVRGNVGIAVGQGEDHVNVGGPMASVTDVNTVIDGRLMVDLGMGHDGLRIAGSRIHHGVLVNGGLGDDSVAVAESQIRDTLAIRTGAGDDQVAIGRTLAAHVLVGMGEGADRLALVDSTFASIGAHLGGGPDQLMIAGVNAGLASFQGGAGNDVLQFNGASQFGRLRISGFETVGGGTNAASTGEDDRQEQYDVGDSWMLAV